MDCRDEYDAQRHRVGDKPHEPAGPQPDTRDLLVFDAITWRYRNLFVAARVLYWAGMTACATATVLAATGRAGAVQLCFATLAFAIVMGTLSTMIAQNAERSARLLHEPHLAYWAQQVEMPRVLSRVGVFRWALRGMVRSRLHLRDGEELALIMSERETRMVLEWLAERNPDVLLAAVYCGAGKPASRSRPTPTTRVARAPQGQPGASAQRLPVIERILKRLHLDASITACDVSNQPRMGPPERPVDPAELYRLVTRRFSRGLLICRVLRDGSAAALLLTSLARLGVSWCAVELLFGALFHFAKATFARNSCLARRIVEDPTLVYWAQLCYQRSDALVGTWQLGRLHLRDGEQLELYLRPAGMRAVLDWLSTMNPCASCATTYDEIGERGTPADTATRRDGAARRFGLGG